MATPVFDQDEVTALARVLAAAALDDLLSKFETDATPPDQKMRGVLGELDDAIVQPLSE